MHGVAQFYPLGIAARNVKTQLFVIVTIVLLSGCMPYAVRKTPGVSGRVINSISGKAVIGAQVGFVGLSSLRAKTDREGKFSIPPTTKLGIIFLIPYDPAQKYLPFEVFHVGYQPLQTSAPFYDFLHRDTLNLELKPL